MTLALLDVLAARENCLRLTFDAPVYYTRWFDPHDAAHPSRYIVTPVAGTIGLDGEPARAVSIVVIEKPQQSDGTLLDVWLDRPLSPYGARYVLTVSDLQGADESAFLPDPTSIEFDGLRRGLPTPTADAVVSIRDFANPQSLRGLPPGTVLGTYRVDDTGDYAVDAGEQAVRKRIFRRLTTQKGAFAHLPDYGVNLQTAIKQLNRAGAAAALAADAEAQVRQEPEVQACSVRVDMSQAANGVVVFHVRVRLALGAAFEQTVTAQVGAG